MQHCGHLERTRSAPRGRTAADGADIPPGHSTGLDLYQARKMGALGLVRGARFSLSGEAPGVPTAVQLILHDLGFAPVQSDGEILVACCLEWVKKDQVANPDAVVFDPRRGHESWGLHPTVTMSWWPRTPTT